MLCQKAFERGRTKHFSVRIIGIGSDMAYKNLLYYIFVNTKANAGQEVENIEINFSRIDVIFCKIILYLRLFTSTKSCNKGL